MKSGPLHFTLIAAATLSAFSLGKAAPDLRAQLGVLFAPVSRPTRAIGLWAKSQLSPTPPTDVLSPDHPRSADELRQQNAILIAQVQNLQAQLDDLKRLSAAYRQLGALQQLVEPAAVLGGPTTNRQTLTIGTNGLSAIRKEMPVVHAAGFVGQVDATATIGGSAIVLLATDPDSALQARFARTVVAEDGRVTTQMLPLDPIAAVGDGRQIIATKLPAIAVRDHLRVDDVVLLDEPRLGPALKGVRLGTVAKITLPNTTAAYASVEIRPTTDLSHLNEVLVVTKQTIR